MSRLVKKRSKKAGLPPGSLGPYRREKRARRQRLPSLIMMRRMFRKRKSKRLRNVLSSKTSLPSHGSMLTASITLERLKSSGSVTGYIPWFSKISSIRISVRRWRTMINTTYIVLKMLYYRERSGQIEAEQISLILGRNFVISFQEGKEGDVFGPIRERIRNG